MKSWSSPIFKASDAHYPVATGEGGHPECPDWCGMSTLLGGLSWWEQVQWGEVSFVGMDSRGLILLYRLCAPRQSVSLSSCSMQLWNATPCRVHWQPRIWLAYSKSYNNLGAQMITEIITYDLKDYLFNKRKKKSIVILFLLAALSLYLTVLSI